MIRHSLSQALEEFGAAFTGASCAHYNPTHVDMKMRASSAGLNVPPYFVARKGGPAVADLVASSGVQFPLIVKRPESSGSDSASELGGGPSPRETLSGFAGMMAKASRCGTLEEVEVQVGKFLDRFGAALVEESIEGVEVAVLTAEVVEDVDAESTGSSSTGSSSSATTTTTATTAATGEGGSVGAPDLATAHLPCVTFAPVHRSLFPARGEPEPGTALFGVATGSDLMRAGHKGMPWSRIMGQPALEASVRAAGVAAFRAIMGGRGYGRCDLRVDGQGKVWFLEMVPSCGLFNPGPHGSKGPEDWILALDPTTSGAHFAEAMVVAALQRQQEAAACVPLPEPTKLAPSPQGPCSDSCSGAGKTIH
jgi:hypothetical protein